MNLTLLPFPFTFIIIKFCLLFISKLAFISSDLSLRPSPHLSPVIYYMVFDIFSPFPFTSSPSISIKSIIFAMLCFSFFLSLAIFFPPVCSSICVPGNITAGAGAQFSAGSRAPGGGMVQGPSAVWGPSVRHALDPLSH